MDFNQSFSSFHFLSIKKQELSSCTLCRIEMASPGIPSFLLSWAVSQAANAALATGTTAHARSGSTPSGSDVRQTTQSLWTSKSSSVNGDKNSFYLKQLLPQGLLSTFTSASCPVLPMNFSFPLRLLESSSSPLLSTSQTSNLLTPMCGHWRKDYKIDKILYKFYRIVKFRNNLVLVKPWGVFFE